MPKMVEPLGDRILVRIVKEEQTTGGIFLPDTAQEKPQIAEVLAVGPELKAPVKPKDTVIFAQYAGAEVRVEGVNYLLIGEADILGRLVEVGVPEPELAGV